jgi:hypothetical protein
MHMHMHVLMRETTQAQHMTAHLVSSYVIDPIQLHPCQFIESRRQHCHRHRPNKKPPSVGNRIIHSTTKCS